MEGKIIIFRVGSYIYRQGMVGAKDTINYGNDLW